MKMKMTKEDAQYILRSLEIFDGIERKATDAVDAVGWIALRKSCTRVKAERLIREAREMMVEARGETTPGAATGGAEKAGAIIDEEVATERAGLAERVSRLEVEMAILWRELRCGKGLP